MQSLYAIALYVVLFAGMLFLVDAVFGLVRAARGRDDDAVQRRLSHPAEGLIAAEAPQYNVLRTDASSQTWTRYVPFFSNLTRLMQTSGTGVTIQRLLTITALLAVLIFVVLAILLPRDLLPISMLGSPLAAAALVLLYLRSARAKRRARFEEQLPEAIDLIVRSLKVGHPLSGAMAVVGRELPAPVSTEFAIASEEISYGQDIPTAFAKMAERMPVPDLGYFAMAVQIQQESGGNLVESLAKLCAVIRERFRMFRKVKALTAEGRFSAWFLSVFPFVLVLGIQLIKPDYYTQVMDLPIFPQLVAATFFLLGVNIVAMRVITNIKV